jgi:NADH:ubiquinone oxidoreductase subunit 4 (subunit M)
MLHMVARLVFGPLKLPQTHDDHTTDAAPVATKRSHDLTPREVAILTPLAVLVIVLGVFPSPILDSILDDVGLVRDTPIIESTDETATAIASLDIR